MMISFAFHRLDRLEQLTGARIGGLAALDHRRDPELAKDRRQPVAGGDREHTEGLRRGRRGRDRRHARAAARKLHRVRAWNRTGERSRTRLADVAGLVIEILDTDPAQGVPTDSP